MSHHQQLILYKLLLVLTYWTWLWTAKWWSFYLNSKVGKLRIKNRIFNLNTVDSMSSGQGLSLQCTVLQTPIKSQKVFPVITLVQITQFWKFLGLNLWEGSIFIISDVPFSVLKYFFAKKYTIYVYCHLGLLGALQICTAEVQWKCSETAVIHNLVQRATAGSGSL